MIKTGGTQARPGVTSLRRRGGSTRASGGGRFGQYSQIPVSEIVQSLTTTLSYLIDEVKGMAHLLHSRHARLVSLVAISGFVITGLCLSLLFLVDLQSSTNSGLSVGKPTKPSATSIAKEQHESASQSEGEDAFNIIVLHPNDHVHRAPTTIRLAWNITLEKNSPDGVLKSVYLINGMIAAVFCSTRYVEVLITYSRSISRARN